MKKAMVLAAVFLAVIIFATWSVWAADWEVPITNQAPVVPVKTRLNFIGVNIPPTGTNNTTVTVQWTRFDSSNRVVKVGYSKFTEPEIDVILKTVGSSAAQMKGLFTLIAAKEAAQ